MSDQESPMEARQPRRLEVLPVGLFVGQLAIFGRVDCRRFQREGW
ncbi:MAG TPA: hypothetical protein VJP78_02680 [Thermoleophilia bacterium]|nr:hypothetical protein [Thermoleophilia bacterium]